MQIRPAGAGLFYADRPTDMTKLTVTFRNFANAPKISSISCNSTIQYNNIVEYFPPWLNNPKWGRASSLSRLHDHTQTHHSR